MLSPMLRSLSVPAGNERGPLFMDQVLAAVHQGNPRKMPVTLLILRHADRGRLQALPDGPMHVQTAGFSCGIMRSS